MEKFPLPQRHTVLQTILLVWLQCKGYQCRKVGRFIHTTFSGWKMRVSHKGFLIPTPWLPPEWIDCFLLKPALVPDEQMQLEPRIPPAGIWWVYPCISRMEQVVCRGLLHEHYEWWSFLWIEMHFPVKWKPFSCICVCATLQTIAHQPPLSTEFSKQ